MKRFVLLLFLLGIFSTSKAQLYFPPIVGTTWETTDPATLGWCQDSIDVLYDYLDQTNSKAFIVLKDGRIVLEKYFGTFTVDSFWVWNSAGKTLTALAVGIAQEEGFLNISDTTSDYLGTGWTNMTLAQEEKVTIRHQLTMTTGIDDTQDFYCTDPICLNYLTDPTLHWAYYNAPYTLLDGVIANATGVTLNQWITQKIKTPTGMTGAYFPIDYNNIFISTPRSMARFGLLLHNEGIWNGTPVLNDPQYFQEMTTSSQSLNPSYGYLTWLNGQSSYMVPGVQFSFAGSPMPNAPADVIAALGKDAQIINSSASTGLVVIRMGNADGNSLVSTQYNDTIWQYINRLSCTNALEDVDFNAIQLYPNPLVAQTLTIEGIRENDQILFHSIDGQFIATQLENGQLTLPNLASGIYLITINRSGQEKTFRLQVN